VPAWMRTVDVDQSVRCEVYRSVLVIWGLLIAARTMEGEDAASQDQRKQEAHPSYRPMFAWLATRVSSGYRSACTGMEPSRERPSEFMLSLRLTSLSAIGWLLRTRHESFIWTLTFAYSSGAARDRLCGHYISSSRKI
jgi:hypothetical protein